MEPEVTEAREQRLARIEQAVDTAGPFPLVALDDCRWLVGEARRADALAVKGWSLMRERDAARAKLALIEAKCREWEAWAAEFPPAENVPAMYAGQIRIILAGITDTTDAKPEPTERRLSRIERLDKQHGPWSLEDQVFLLSEARRVAELEADLAHTELNRDIAARGHVAAIEAADAAVARVTQLEAELNAALAAVMSWHDRTMETNRERVEAVAALTRIRALHAPEQRSWGKVCTECGDEVSWPCPTAELVLAAAVGVADTGTLQEFRVTFGLKYGEFNYPRPPGAPYAHPDGWLTIMAPDEFTARNVALLVLGRDWCSILNEGEFSKMGPKPMGELARITAPFIALYGPDGLTDKKGKTI